MKLSTVKLKTPLSHFKPRAYARRVNRFRNEENGSMIIFSLFMFVLILWLAGLSVDLIRVETARAKIQGTLDRATLAAADLDQTLDCEAVVVDYFTKSGLLEFLDVDGIDCEEGLNYRTVSANAEVELPLFFYDIPRVFTQPFSPGLTTWDVSGNSTAEERVSDIEVSLVLDVSGSMSRNNRITNLRPAARDFVTTVLANNTNAPDGLITVSMVPYSAVVNPGTLISPYLNINRTHGFSSCLLFDDDVFDSTAIDLSETYDHVGHFDPAWYSGNAEPIRYPWCHLGDHNGVIPTTSNETVLHNAINALAPYGNTAIDMGMKWGVGLLDPSTRNIITALAGSTGTNVDTFASGRPYDHTEPDVVKVVVLMTDGENTRQYDLYDRFKTELSFVWFDLSDDPSQALYEVSNSDISIQYSGHQTPEYYYDDRFFWNGINFGTRTYSYPRGYSSQAQYVAARQNYSGTTAIGVGPTYTGHVREASWQELFNNWEYDRIDNELTREAYNARVLPWSQGTTTARNEFGGVLPDASGNSYSVYLPDYRDSSSSLDTYLVNSTEANQRLSDLCAAARDEGIIIYTVAFEAPTAGQNALQDCATSDSHYFDVDGTDISTAFSAIASDIRALKLTD